MMTWAVMPAAHATAIPTCNGKAATIPGTSAGELIVGTSGDDVIVGNGGQDQIFGLAGNDTICGGQDDDMINGGKGRDYIDAGRGQDTILGGDDKDEIHGNAGIDSCTDVTPAEAKDNLEHDCDADFSVTADIQPEGGPFASLTGQLVNNGPSKEHTALLRIELTASTGGFDGGWDVHAGYHTAVSCSPPNPNTETHIVQECIVDMAPNTHIDVSGGMIFGGDVTFSMFTSPGRSIDPDWTDNTASDFISGGVTTG
jgi:hypothetical protein